MLPASSGLISSVARPNSVGAKRQLSSASISSQLGDVRSAAKLKVWMTIVESGWNAWVWLVGCGYQEVGVASGSGWNLWVWLVGGMYGCGYQEVGVVGRRRVWLAGGIYGCGYQEVGVVSRRRVWLAGGMYGCGYQEVGVVGNYWCG